MSPQPTRLRAYSTYQAVQLLGSTSNCLIFSNSFLQSFYSFTYDRRITVEMLTDVFLQMHDQMGF